MTVRIIKYSAAALYVIFFALLIYYSFYFKRADILTGILFLSSFFFLSVLAIRKNPGLFDVCLFYAAAISAVIISAAGFYGIIAENSVRISGILGDRAFEAEAAALIFVFMSAQYVFRNEKILNTLLSYVAIFLSAGYLTVLRSRTAYLSVFICFIVLAILFLKKRRDGDINFLLLLKKRILILVAIISISAAAASLIPFQQPPERDSFKNLVSGMFNTEGATNKSRIYFAKASLKMFVSHPLAGVGAGLWSGTYPMYEGKPFTDANVDVNSAVKAHNDFLELISEYGISGFFYILLIAGGMISLFRKFYKDIFYAPYIFVIICFSVSSLFGFPKDNLFAALFFLACLAAGFTAQENDDRKSRFVLIAGLILLLIFLFSTGLLFTRNIIEKNYLEGINLKFKKDYRGSLEKLSEVNKVLFPVDRSGIPVDYYRGVMYFELQEYHKSLEAFENASLIMPYYPTVMSNKASALYKTGKVTEAITLYKEIQKLFPYFFEPQINLLAVYANEKRDKEAVSLLKDLETVAMEPKFIKNYIVFSDIKNYYSHKDL